MTGVYIRAGAIVFEDQGSKMGPVGAGLQKVF